MVGMEQVEVPSKAYLVRWIQVQSGETISWSIQPHKKSLNFGIFKHPGGLGGPGPGSLPAAPPIPSDGPVPTPTQSAHDVSDPTSRKAHGAKISRNEKSTVVQKLEELGMKKVSWTGKCEAEKVTMGKFDVVEGEGGMYGLVFDNTFSKQVSKTATFVLMTYLTDSPPKSGHHLHFSQASAATSSSNLAVKHSPALGPVSSTDSLLPEPIPKSVAADPRPRSGHAMESKSFGGSTFYTGILNKKRRKHNTYARRFFSLDFTTSTLSYYKNRHSSALRGAIPLSLAAVVTIDRTREISVDSGAELWHLKAGNQKDFLGWKDALERASQIAGSAFQPTTSTTGSSPSRPSRPADPLEERDWAVAEGLVGHVSGIRDSVRRLAQDTDPKYLPSGHGNGIGSPSDAGSIDQTREDQDPKPGEKIPFWKRKPSGTSGASSLFKRSLSAQLGVPMSSSGPSPSYNGNMPISKRPNYSSTALQNDESLHGRCMEILRDLDAVVSEFSDLLTESKMRRLNSQVRSPDAAGRKSLSGSISSDEFFDAHEGDTSTIRSAFLSIRRDSQDVDSQRPDQAPQDDVSDDGSSDSSEDFDESVRAFSPRSREESGELFPSQPKSLPPLPLSPVERRKTVPPAKTAPPSLISFLRKNVGKDLSTIAMPVTANEPTSVLQRVSEQMEYSELLDMAAADEDPTLRMLYIASFAVSSFSSSRVKERAARKPFNPMLGETYELVREDKGFRLLAEKISHRPVRAALQAESEKWTLLQAPMPSQKFWGKSVELNTEGAVRIILHKPDEVYAYIPATCFLRNVIAGEKYIEPTSTMTILNETTGMKAIVAFKAGGMFAGRSEEVSVQVFDPRAASSAAAHRHGSHHHHHHGGGSGAAALGAAGKWTSHLNLTEKGIDTGKRLWEAGPLADGGAERRYGFTAFAAALNEMTEMEKGKVAPTDSRLRPDQRALEAGDVGTAEQVKGVLEERQRVRRKAMEERGEEWIARWFVRVGGEDGEGMWRLRGGREGYWDRRERGEWGGGGEIFEVGR